MILWQNCNGSIVGISRIDREHGVRVSVTVLISYFKQYYNILYTSCPQNQNNITIYNNLKKNRKTQKKKIVVVN